jgi:hypothetical protein
MSEWLLFFLCLIWIRGNPLLLTTVFLRVAWREICAPVREKKQFVTLTFSSSLAAKSVRKKGWGTFCGCFDPIKKQRQFHVKLSAIVGPRVSCHSYEFQLDRRSFCLPLVLNQISSPVIRLRDDNSYFWKDIYLILSLIYIPCDAELNFLQNYINIFK